MKIHLLQAETKERILLGKLMRDEQNQPIGISDGIEVSSFEKAESDLINRKIIGFLLRHLKKDVKVLTEYQVDDLADLKEYSRVDHLFGDNRYKT